MSTNYYCPKCGATAFASVFLIPGEELPDDVKLRRYLSQNLSPANLEKLDPTFHGPCGHCLVEKAIELGLVKTTVDEILKQKARAETMEIEIFS